MTQATPTPTLRRWTETIALVTGANRGIGRSLVDALIERGVPKVYAAARNPDTVQTLVSAHPERVVALKLDVTRPADIEAAAGQARDVNLLINNAGTLHWGDVLAENAREALRADLAVNLHGAHDLTLALADSLKANRGGIILLSSIAGLANFPALGTYSISKAAVHSLTQGLRAALKPAGVQVSGVYPGPVDTDMADQLEMDKASPASVAAQILDGFAAGAEDIFPDPMAEEVGTGYAGDPKAVETQFAAMAAEDPAA
ncbi:MAG: SDR family oxidoreductase [Opitutales bacterium]